MRSTGSARGSSAAATAASKRADSRARLRDILGHAVPRPRAWQVTNWQGSPYTRGGYTAMVVGASPDDFDVLAAPVDGRLLFCGEHTHRHRYAHADGAMTTGIREAKRLLRSAAVTLSAG